MSELVVGVSHFLGMNLHSEFKKTDNKVKILEEHILNLELELCQKKKALFLTKQRLEELEKRIVGQVINVKET